MGKKYARVPQHRHPNAVENIFDSAAGDLRSARAAVGGPAGRNEEDIEAVDLVMPVPQPEIRQARQLGFDGSSPSTPPAQVKAYIAKDAPPPLPPAATKINALERELQETTRAQRALQPKINGIQEQIEKAGTDGSKSDKEAKAKMMKPIIEKAKLDLQDAENQQIELMEKGDTLRDEIKSEKITASERFVQMHPAGHDGTGVEAKVSVDALRPLYPEGLLTGQPHSGIGPLTSTAGAVLLSAARNSLQRDIHFARRQSASFL